jgi:hypothetical protein
VMRKRPGTTPPRPVKRPPKATPTARMVIAATTLRRLRRRGRRVGQGGIGSRKFSTTSQMLSLMSPKVAYHWSLRGLPKGTSCN